MRSMVVITFREDYGAPSNRRVERLDIVRYSRRTARLAARRWRDIYGAAWEQRPVCVASGPGAALQVARAIAREHGLVEVRANSPARQFLRSLPLGGA